MTSTLTFLVVASLILVIAFQLLMSAELLGAIMTWIGNPILRKLGLQSKGKSSSDFIGRLVKVLATNGSEIRVDLNGTSWKALKNDPDWTPIEGELVRIEGIEGITLSIAKENNKN